jgi:hypothetical protein
LKRLTITLCLAALVALVAVPNAGAHTARISSQHQLAFTPDEASDVFHGQMSSAVAACRGSRAVTLYRKVGDASVPDAVVTTAKTNSTGNWSKGVGNAQAGRYYAVAARKVVKNTRHKHICLPSSSNTGTVPQTLLLTRVTSTATATGSR